MVGNKHKNGIICTYPNCNKSMRTQKFKMHFTRAHLKEGEVYSVEHRRRFEVAREENTRSTMKSELAGADSIVSGTATATSPMMTLGGNAQKKHGDHVAKVHEEFQTAQARRVLAQPINLSSQPNALAIFAASIESGATKTNAMFKSANGIDTTPKSIRMPLPSEHTSSSKRPLAEIVGSVGNAADPTSVLMMHSIALMDQRFQELVGKMGEMIDVQKTLIDTLQASIPNGRPPSSSFSQAAKVDAKRRKKDSSPHGNGSSENGNVGDNINGEGPGLVL